MGKKSNRSHQPNAPEFHQILLDSPTIQQPPHNPYYPELGDNFTSLPSPPPYSVAYNSVPMSQVNVQSSNYNNNFNRPLRMSTTGPSTVIVQPPVAYQSYRGSKRNKKVRKHNNEMIILCLVVIVLSVFAHSLYSQRPCNNFLVQKLSSDVSIMVFDVRDAHLTVAYSSVVVLILCLAKCASGDSNSHSCYLLLMGLLTFFLAVFTGYLAYLAYYSPCTLKIQELASNFVKTAIGGLFDTSLPSPDKRPFGESNVIELAKDDKPGLAIFSIDLLNFILYLSSFLSVLMLC